MKQRLTKLQHDHHGSFVTLKFYMRVKILIQLMYCQMRRFQMRWHKLRSYQRLLKSRRMLHEPCAVLLKMVITSACHMLQFRLLLVSICMTLIVFMTFVMTFEVTNRCACLADIEWVWVSIHYTAWVNTFSRVLFLCSGSN